MTINIANAPCSWGVDYAEDFKNPSWKDVFREISKAPLYPVGDPFIEESKRYHY